MKGGGWEPADWSPDDKQLLVVEGISINESYLWLFDAQTGEKKEITPRPAEGAEKVSYSSGAIFEGWQRHFRHDRSRIGIPAPRLHRSRQRQAHLPPARREVGRGQLGFEPRRQTNRLHLEREWREHAAPDRTRAGKRHGDGSARRKIPHSIRPCPPSSFPALRWHRDPKQGLLAFNVAGARSPSDVYTWSTAGGKNTTARWTASETGGIPATRFVEPELVRWKSFDGKEITGFLYTPDAAKFPGPRPVIINIHGGPEAQYRPGYLGRNNYFINELGCAIIFPNVRGSEGYGKTFLKLDNGFKREDSYKDISALARLDSIRGPSSMPSGSW